MGKIGRGSHCGCLTPRRTGRLTVGRNMTLTLTLTWVPWVFAILNIMSKLARGKLVGRLQF
jgi:hypothetical protein